MNEAFFFFLPSPFCFCLHLVVVLFDPYRLLFPASWCWTVKGRDAEKHSRALPLPPNPPGYISHLEDSRSFLESLVFCETDLILSYK